MSYEERRAKYDEEYEAYAQACRGNGEEPEPPEPRPKGGFHAIPATNSVPQQLKELHGLRKQGIVKTSPPLPGACKGFAWRNALGD